MLQKKADGGDPKPTDKKKSKSDLRDRAKQFLKEVDGASKDADAAIKQADSDDQRRKRERERERERERSSCGCG